MFGIGSQQNDMLEEQYRVKYLKYKEKYLKLKQHGGFGRTSSGIHCFLTSQGKAEELKNKIATLSLDGITEMLHDQAYVVKDGSSEVNLVQKTAMSNMFSKKVPLNNADKITNTVVMNRCNNETIQSIRKNIKKENERAGKLNYIITKTDQPKKVNREREAGNKAEHLTHMVVINIVTYGKGHTLVGDIQNVRRDRTNASASASASELESKP
jgi:hypothetical protein